MSARNDIIPLQCKPGVLEALAVSLVGYAIAGLELEWLVTGLWLQSAAQLYLVSASIDILGDGTIARPLNIATANDVLDEVGASLPDIHKRIEARGSAQTLPAVPESIPPPKQCDPWFEAGYAMEVVIRPIERAETLHRVASGLVFTRADGERFIVAADTSSLALVVSKEEEAIGRYLDGCDMMSPERYRAATA